MIDDSRAALEEEREFLLRSIRDLDAEHAAGDIADGDYARLRDGYTARAARVLRALDGSDATAPAAAAPTTIAAAEQPTPAPVASAPAAVGEAATAPASPSVAADATTATPSPSTAGEPPRAAPAPAGLVGERPDAPTADVAMTGDPGRAGGARRPPRRRRARTVVASVVVLLVGVGAGLALAFSAGERSPGQSATGSIPSGAIEDRVTKAQQLVGDGKILDAVKLYDEILQDDPENPVALAQRGWLVSRVDPTLIDTGMASIDKALAIDPGYAEAHFFKGMILWQAKADPAGGADEFQKAIDAGAPPDLKTYLVQERDQARAEANGQPPPSTTTVP